MSSVMRTAALVLVFFALLPSARALTFNESFTTTTQKASGTTVVWNYELGFLHPTLLVSALQAPSQPVTSQTVVVGDGSDGVFNNTTYSSFGSVVGSTITIDASLRPLLQVSSFQLDSGMTLTAINGPLIIYSLSTVNIDGIIECSGVIGNPAAGVAGGTGGGGRCGGFSGGNGGNVSTSGSGGLPLAGAVSGGAPGVYNGVGFGAGGGGAGSFSGNPGGAGISAAPNTGGAGGNGAANFEFTNLSGSPGGGGGSGSNTAGGAGGGGGGGTVVIHAVGNVSVSASGAILAMGGNGGAASTGGGGGGGSGGSVKIMTPANLNLATGIPIDVSGGSGSIPSTAAAGDGGNASFGRTWDNSKTFSGLGTESHASGLISVGTVEYSTTALVALTNTFDTASVLPIYSSITSNPVNGDISIDVAGSTDNFSTNDSGWLPAASIATLNNKRYIKFRLNLTNSNAATPTIVNDVTINYTLGTPAPSPGPSPGPTQSPSPALSPALKENFQFQSGCGRIDSGDQNLLQVSLVLMIFPFLLALFLKCREKNSTAT